MPRRSALAVLLVISVLLIAGCTASVATPVQSATPDRPETPAATATLLSGSSGPGGPPVRDVPGNGTFDVHFIDVGQGSSTLIVGPTDETMLIDSGGWQDEGGDVIDYLERRNVSRIDYLVTSHADADHIGGHAAVIEHFETNGEGVGAIYDPGIAASTQTYEDYLDAVEEHDVTLYQTRAGDRIPFEGVQVEVLAPPEDYLVGGDRNENSLVLRVRHGNSSFLFPGDAADQEEQYLLQQYESGLNSTVLQVGHHGSQSSSSNEFLEASSPSVAVISSAYDSQYGHPHNETLQRLAERDITTFWTGVHGSTSVISNGTHLRLFVQSTATTDPGALRSEPAFDRADAETAVRAGVIPLDESSGGSPVITDGGQTSTPDEIDPETETEDQDSEGGSLVVEEIHADASGNDNENLNDEYLVFANDGESDLDLSGWTVADDAGHQYVFPQGFTLQPGDTVTLHTGSGDDTATDLYWGSDRAVWNNGGDTITLRGTEGELVLEESY